MNKETLRMQFLSGVITESEYKAKLEESKKPLNENFVGMGMVGNIFDREKTDYELAFEHFTKGTSLNEYMEDEDEDENEFDLNQAFKDSPETASYDEVLGIADSYEDPSILDAFQGTFSEDEEVSKKDYFKFFSNYIDDMSDMDYIKANWISIFDEDVYDKAGLNEAKKPGTAKERSAMDKKARAGKELEETLNENFIQGDETVKNQVKTYFEEMAKNYPENLASVLTGLVMGEDPTFEDFVSRVSNDISGNDNPFGLD